MGHGTDVVDVAVAVDVVPSCFVFQFELSFCTLFVPLRTTVFFFVTIILLLVYSRTELLLLFSF